MSSETETKDAEADEETDDETTKPDETTVRSTADAQADADVTSDADEGTDADADDSEDGGIGKAKLALGLVAFVVVLALLWRRRSDGNHLTAPF